MLGPMVEHRFVFFRQFNSLPAPRAIFRHLD